MATDEIPRAAGGKVRAACVMDGNRKADESGIGQ